MGTLCALGNRVSLHELSESNLLFIQSFYPLFLGNYLKEIIEGVHITRQLQRKHCSVLRTEPDGRDLSVSSRCVVKEVAAHSLSVPVNPAVGGVF